MELQHIKQKINEELEAIDKDNINITHFTMQRNLDNFVVNDMKTTENRKIIIEIGYMETKDFKHF